MEGLVRNVWVIAKREFAGYFNTALAFVFVVIFVSLTSAFAFYVGNMFGRGQADLFVFFQYPWQVSGRLGVRWGRAAADLPDLDYGECAG
jgi:hypothetical protein